MYPLPSSERLGLARIVSTEHIGHAADHRRAQASRAHDTQPGALAPVGRLLVRLGVALGAEPSSLGAEPAALKPARSR